MNSSIVVRNNQPTTKITGTYNKWTMDNDVQLCLSWVAILIDCVVGKDRSLTALWDRIHEHYIENSKDKFKRLPKQLMKRFIEINAQSNNYYHILKQVENRQANDTNKDDMLVKEANKLFVELYGKAYQFSHCWPILNAQSRWRDYNMKLAKKQSKKIQRITALKIDEDNEDAIIVDETKEKELESNKSIMYPLVRQKYIKREIKRRFLLNSNAGSLANYLKIDKIGKAYLKELKRSNELAQLKYEKEIMLVDVSAIIDEKSHKFFEFLRNDIIKRYNL